MPEIDISAPVLRGYIARVEDVNPKDRTVVSKITTSALDHYRTVIDPKGIDLSAYNLNRIVLWEHGMDPQRGSLPIGRNGWIRPAIGPNGPELIAQTRFYEPGSRKADDFTERLFEMYRDGDLRGFSVRVVPTAGGENSPPTKDEIRSRPELVDCYCMYRSTKLTEYSCCAVPGNCECLTTEMKRSVLHLVARGLALPPELVARARELADGELETVEFPPDLPALTGRSLEQARVELAAQLRGMLDPKLVRDQIRMERDYQRGVV
jgi:hypothetical protein